MPAPLHTTMYATGRSAPGEAEAEDPPEWPIQLVLQSCNVDITDAPPEGSVSEGLDLHSPNPFLPSLMMIAEGAQGAKVGPRSGEGRKGKGRGQCV